MARVEVHTIEGGGKRLWFTCPGCGLYHAPAVKKGTHDEHSWRWNGCVDKPTLTPSLLVRVGGEKPIKCHSYIKEGQIQFLNDSTHKLAGQTVDLFEITEEQEDSP